MNKKELIRRVADVMREKDIRKSVSYPKKVFHISDDEGNTKDFIVKRTNKNVLFNSDDIGAVIDTCLGVICEAIKNGESVSVHGFGTLGLKYREARATKRPGTEDWVEVSARYVPKFVFGNDLRMCAKIYELSLNDKDSLIPPPIPDESDDDCEEG